MARGKARACASLQVARQRPSLERPTRGGHAMSAPPENEIDILALGTCPLPKYKYDQILLGHGSGGGLTADLIKHVFMPGFDNEILSAMEDQATIRIGGNNGAKGARLAFTTDSFVVRPLFFPGGDIGDRKST